MHIYNVWKVLHAFLRRLKVRSDFPYGMKKIIPTVAVRSSVINMNSPLARINVIVVNNVSDKINTEQIHRL